MYNINEVLVEVVRFNYFIISPDSISAPDTHTYHVSESIQ